MKCGAYMITPTWASGVDSSSPCVVDLPPPAAVARGQGRQSLPVEAGDQGGDGIAAVAADGPGGGMSAGECDPEVWADGP